MKALRFALCFAMLFCATLGAQTSTVSGNGLVGISGAAVNGILTFRTNDCHGHAVTVTMPNGLRYSGVAVSVTNGVYSASVFKPASFGGAFCYQAGTFDNNTGSSQFVAGFGAYSPSASNESLATAQTSAQVGDYTVPLSATVPGLLPATTGGTTLNIQYVPIPGPQGNTGSAATVNSNGTNGGFNVAGNFFVGGVYTGNEQHTGQMTGDVNATLNFTSPQYGGVCDGTTNNNAAFAAIFAAARSTNPVKKIHFPSGSCGFTGTLDVSGLVLQGDGTYLTILKQLTVNPGVDSLQSKGNTILRDLQVFAGWDGHTTGLNGNGFSTVSNPGSGVVGYNNRFDNVSIQYSPHNCVYINDGAYEQFHNIKCNASGSDSLFIDSDNYATFQTTSTSFTGLNTFSDAQGYGVSIHDGISVNFSGSVTTLENTTGMRVYGTNNRAIDFGMAIYEENTTGTWLNLAGSGGIGLNVGGGFGITTPINCAQLSNWSGWRVANGTFAPCGVAGGPVVNFGYNGFTDAFQQLNGSWIFNNGGYTPMNTLPFTAGKAWHAIFIGNWVTGTTRSSIQPMSELSSGFSTINLSGCTVGFQIDSNGYFGGTFVSGNGCGPVGFTGTVFVTNDVATSGDTRNFFATNNNISTLATVSAGQYATNSGGMGYTGTCPGTMHSVTVSGGIVIGCNTTSSVARVVTKPVAMSRSLWSWLKSIF